MGVEIEDLGRFFGGGVIWDGFGRISKEGYFRKLWKGRRMTWFRVIYRT